MSDVGDRAPDFTLPSTAGDVSLRSLNPGRKLVLAFYTEDNTPGCAQMLSSLKAEYPTIQELGADVLAINADSVESHDAFCEAIGGLPFPLASDVDLRVSGMYGVIGEDRRRTVRAVFVLDEEGAIIHKIGWFQPGNVAQFMEIFQALGLE